MAYLYNEILLSRKKEFLLSATAQMELESIMLSQKKPVSEKQLPYDFTYKRNLKNTIN